MNNLENTNNEGSQYDNSRPYNGGSRPPYNSSRPPYSGGSRPPYSGSRPPYSGGSRPPYSGSRPPYGDGSRPPMGEGGRPPMGERRFQPRTFAQRNDSGYRINREIRNPIVRLVGDNIENSGMVSGVIEAQRLADSMGLDLVEISPNSDPPVCKIIDFQKFLYQQRRRQKELKASQVRIDVKEIRFGYATGEHDYQFKLRHAENFIGEGNKVRAYVFFRGREINYTDQGEALLARFASDLADIAKVEIMPKLEGKKMFLVLAPKSKKGN